MKKYNKIYVVPNVGSEVHEQIMDGVLKDFDLLPTHNVIVLTVQEANDIFTAGYNRGVEAAKNKGTRKALVCPDFKSYITDKGIELP